MASQAAFWTTGSMVSSTDAPLTGFIAQMAALRAAHPVLRQTRFLHGERGADGHANVIWRKADATPPEPADWQGEMTTLGMELRAEGDVLYCVFNAGGPCRLTLPDTAPRWRMILSSAAPAAPAADCHATLDLPGQAVLVFEPL